MEESPIKPKRFPVTFEELLKDKMTGSVVRNIVIDDVDILLQRVVGNLEIEAITITGEHIGSGPHLPKDYIGTLKREDLFEPVTIRIMGKFKE